MNIEEKIFETAKKLNKTIVFPEGTCDRVLKACEYLTQNNICNCVVVGDEKEVCKVININDKIKVLNQSNFNDLKILIDTLYIKRKHKGMTQELAEKTLDNNVYFATMLVECGYVDGMVCGAITTTADSIKPGLEIVKSAEGVKTISSCFLMSKDNIPFSTHNVICLADCGLIVNPTSEQLCDIAVSTANFYEKISGNKAKVAMLSFSTNGSGGNDPSVLKVRQAIDFLKDKNVQFEFDGEMQFDCATQPRVAKTKYPNSKVAGEANVLVFPDLNAGNIGYKIMQYSMEAKALGPVMLGFKKPINDVSRGATFMEIALIGAITVMQC